MSRRITFCLLLVTGVALHADEYADLFRDGANYTEQKRFDEAISRYKAALAIRPGAPEALNNLAVLYYQTRRYTESFKTAAPIWASHPELKSAALIVGMSAVQCNRPGDAIAPLTQLLHSDPGNRDALLALAGARLALHQFSTAAQVYETETAYSPNDSTAWYGRGICYEQLAESASKQLSHIPGGTAYSKRLLAEYLQSAGDSRLAQEAFGASLAASSEPSPEASRQYEIAKEFARNSKASFEQLVAIAPDSWQAAVFLGDVDRQHNDLHSAIAHYQRAADEQPAQPAPLLGLGTAYWELGNFDRASSYLNQTLALNPNAYQAVFELANIAVRRHADAQAITLLVRYLAAQPDALAAHADLGRAYSHLGRYEEAARELSKAAAADDRGDIHYQLSIAFRKLRRAQEAEAALQESTALRQAQLQREQRLHSDR